MIRFILSILLFTALLYDKFSFWLVFSIAFLISLCIYIVQKKSKIQSLDLLVQRSSLLTWNTSLKVFCCVFVLFFCVAVNSFWISLTIIVTMSTVTIITDHLRLTQYIRLLLVPMTFLLISGLVLLFEISPRPLGLLNISLGKIYLIVTNETQAQTAQLLLKAMGALCCLYALSISTPVYELTSFFDQIHVPTIVIELAILIYRYIFILQQLLQQMKQSATARSGYRNYRTSWRSFCGIASNLMVRSFVKANRSFDAMEARAYHEKIQFWVEKKPIKSSQLALSLRSCIHKRRSKTNM